MHKVMVFIDFENFNISLNQYCFGELRMSAPHRIDYLKLPQCIVDSLPGQGNRLVKTFLFAPKPDDFLMKDTRKAATWNWLDGMKNKEYFNVIEGEHVARPAPGRRKEDMDINDKNTFYVVEKGTDVLMAAHVLTKAFHNTFDTAVLVSGDSDYGPILDILNTIGKTSVCVGVKGQILDKLKKRADDIMILNDEFFQKCIRQESVKSKWL